MELNESYLRALEEHLGRHLSAELRARRVDEIRAHLAMDQEERIASGLDRVAAARAARKVLGSPEVLARQMVRQARGYDSSSALRLTWRCGIALILATVVPFYYLICPRVFSPLSDLALHWLPFLVLLYFVFLVARTRRWLAWPMAAWAAITTIGVCAVSLIPPPTTTPPSPEAIHQVEASVRQLMSEQKIFEAAQGSSARAPVSTRSERESYWVPLLPFNIGRSSTSYELAYVAPGEAPKLWRANRTGYQSDIRERLANLQFAISQMRHPTATVWQPTFDGLLCPFLIGTAEQTTVFLIVNWTVLIVSGMLLRRKTHRDPLLA